MKIVIVGHYQKTVKSDILKLFPYDWKVQIVEPDELGKTLHDVNVLIPEHTTVDDGILSNAKKLRLIQTGSGYDNIDLNSCKKHGTLLSNAPGVNAEAVAEQVCGYLICWYRNLISLDVSMKQRKESISYTGKELSDLTLGIVGFGRTGKEVARLCEAFHMNILVFSRNQILQQNKFLQTDLDDLLQKSDAVSLHISLDQSTRNLISFQEFIKMKQDSFIINTSRGAVIDERALIHALENNLIGGAALDVFSDEPLPVESPLRSLKNVILTPHTAGMPDGPGMCKKRIDYFVENIRRLESGEKLQNLVVS